MEEQRVNFETAKLAKEKGFDHASNYPLWYNSDGTEASIWSDFWNIKKDEYKTHQAILRPTQSLLQKWLREKYHIHIELQLSRDEDNEYRDWWFYIYPQLGGGRIKFFPHEIGKRLSYEEALDIGLQEALKLI